MYRLLYLILVLFLTRARSENVKNAYEPGSFSTRFHEIVMINNITNNTCASDVLYMIDAMSRTEMWAVKMFDASSKVQSGFAEGNIVNLGAYDECLSIKSTIDNREIKGKYCVFPLFFTDYPRPNITFGLPNDLKKEVAKTPGLPIIESICVPDSCNSEELTTVFTYSEITDVLSVKPVFSDILCQVEGTEIEFTLLHWFTLLVLLGDIFLIIVCTAYDFYLLHTKKKPLLKIMISFSLYTNIKQLTTIKKDPDQLTCINGIRSISILWVILGHKFLFLAIYPHSNYVYTLEWIEADTTSLITGALFAVDTFFVISGTLVMYIVLLASSKDFKFNIFHYYLHRAFRLSPAMIMVILFYLTFARYLASGPLAPIMYNFLEEPCERTWWKSMLFMQNTVDAKDLCVQQTWYLAVDTQLYILAPLLFIPIQRWPKVTLIVIIALIIISCVSTFIITWNLELSASYIAIGGAYRNVYGSTLVRSNAWLIGSLLGYLLFIKRGKNVVVPKAVVTLLWIFSIIISSILVYLLSYFNQTYYNRLTSSLYHALSKPLWSFSISWIIFACVHGYGGFLNKFLSNKVFTVIGRLTYSLYLLHIFVIFMSLGKDQEPTKFSNANTIHAYFGDLFYCLILSTIWSLCFESPIIALGKELMPQAMADQLKKIYEENIIAHQQQINNRNFNTRL